MSDNLVDRLTRHLRSSRGWCWIKDAEVRAVRDRITELEERLLVSHAEHLTKDDRIGELERDAARIRPGDEEWDRREASELDDELRRIAGWYERVGDEEAVLHVSGWPDTRTVPTFSRFVDEHLEGTDE